MGFRRLGLALGVAAVAAAACIPGGGGGATATPPGQARSAAEFGGMDNLVAAAKAEGKLNVIGLPREWANYGAIIDGFSNRYGIQVTSDNATATSGDEISTVRQLGTSGRAPDVLDLSVADAMSNTSLFAAYEVATWNDIPTGQKEAFGLWAQDYGGYMSIGFDSARFPKLNTIQDLLGPGLKGAIALNADPTIDSEAMSAVMMASLANGGTLDDISKGVAFFKQLKLKGNLAAVHATTASVKAGTTPVVFDWDYLSVAHGTDVRGWKLLIPPFAIVGDYFAQAINKHAPHPAAARLWEEYLYSDAGQNQWLAGQKRPVRMVAMVVSGSIDQVAAARLPLVVGTPAFLSATQGSAAKNYLATNWSQVGV